jgi:hypothetical protein
MRSLSAHDIINIWERGLTQHPLDRALTILMTAFPELTWGQLTDLAIYQRDTLLSRVQERVFGPSLQGFVECPQCKEQLAITLPTEILFGEESKTSDDGRIIDLLEEELPLRFRFPNSRGLATIAGCTDMQTARAMLANECLVKATQDGLPAPEKTLSADIVDHLSERMEESEQNGETLLSLRCPACGHTWDALFDIATFLWTKISLQAKRLMREVNILARTYGWQEEDILSMSQARRQLYLEMAI